MRSKKFGTLELLLKDDQRLKAWQTSRHKKTSPADSLACGQVRAKQPRLRLAGICIKTQVMLENISNLIGTIPDPLRT